jgi:hypothetical protein
MSVTIDAPETIKTPVAIRLICNDKPGCADECNLHDWKPYSDKLDWSGVADSKNWYVNVIYDDGSDFPVIAVRMEGDEHTATTLSPGGYEKKRSVTVEQIIPTVRLFLSVAVVKDNLKIGHKSFEQLGEIVTAKPSMLFIRGNHD